MPGMALTIPLRRNENGEPSEHEFCFLSLSHQLQQGAPPAVRPMGANRDQRARSGMTCADVVGNVRRLANDLRGPPPVP
jgi:hypothetical protein